MAGDEKNPPSPAGKSRGLAFWGRQVLAAFVVLLVALPLCLGVAIASGAPPALGLIAGIVGGIVVGLLAGSPLQVTGPAAGLAVISLDIIHHHGLGGLGAVVLIAGAMQVVFGLMKVGSWFRAVSPAVVLGMLAGIGALILFSQSHVVFDQAPPGGGLRDLSALPASIGAAFASAGGVWAAGVGLLTIVLIVIWEKFRPKKLKSVPGALVGIGGATILTAILDLPIHHVSLPQDFFGSLQLTTPSAVWEAMGNVGVWIDAGVLAAIASAEAMLCATATDKLEHDGPRTDHDRELLAQGAGNLIAGLFGALPVTGVIVRSSTNVDAGGRTRWSTVLHGLLIFAFVGLFPNALSIIPTTALAATLVVIGLKLLSPSTAIKLWKRERGEALVFLGTLAAIVLTDLLTGVLVGIALSAGKLLWTFTHLEIVRHDDRGAARVDLEIRGAATFVSLPKLAKALEAVPEGVEVHLHIGHLLYIDHACADLFEQWRKRHEERGDEIIVEWNDLEIRQQIRPMKKAVQLSRGLASVAPPPMPAAESVQSGETGPSGEIGQSGEIDQSGEIGGDEDDEGGESIAV